jgi:hypothetical protein
MSRLSSFLFFVWFLAADGLVAGLVVAILAHSHP